MSQIDLRKIAFQILQTAVQAVDPDQAINRYLQREGETLICGSQTYALTNYERIRVIGFGKGSAPMAQTVHALLPDKVTDGLVIVKYGHTLSSDIKIDPIHLVEAGHPVPDQNGLDHTKMMLELISDGTDRDLVLCLISGGGSALLTQPVIGITLSHLQTLTKNLLGAGATINQMNTIRKHLSQVKGGWLAQHLYPATILSLILSDVGGDPLDIVASGPTVPDPDTFSDALSILQEYHLEDSTPPSILTYLKQGQAQNQPETPKPEQPVFERVHNQVVANNAMAAEAAVQKALSLGFQPQFVTQFVEGEARAIGQDIAEQAIGLTTAGKPIALIFGGESTVTLQGGGLGGRCQEMALSAALHLHEKAKNVSPSRDILITCFATDGNDGPNDAAGAFADLQTVLRARKKGFEASAYLDNNDSYHFFQAIDDLIMTGPTNTNVNDLVLVLVR